MIAFKNKVKPWKTEQARDFRKHPTETEAILWSRLRRKSLEFRFRRQAVILGYIVDFWCPQKRLVIEIDGSCHDETKDYDKTRDEALARIGIKTLRIKSSQVLYNIQPVLNEIKTYLEQDQTPAGIIKTKWIWANHP